MLREPHAVGREVVDVRRPDLGLPVTAEVTPTEVVGEDEHDVGARWLRRKTDRGDDGHEQGGDEARQRTASDLVAMAGGRD
jgi:hypothetical protein